MHPWHPSIYPSVSYSSSIYTSIHPSIRLLTQSPVDPSFPTSIHSSLIYPPTPIYPFSHSCLHPSTHQPIFPFFCKYACIRYTAANAPDKKYLLSRAQLLLLLSLYVPPACLPPPPESPCFSFLNVNFFLLFLMSRIREMFL